MKMTIVIVLVRQSILNGIVIKTSSTHIQILHGTLSLHPEIPTDCTEWWSCDNGSHRKMIHDMISKLHESSISKNKVVNESIGNVIDIFEMNSEFRMLITKFYCLMNTIVYLKAMMHLQKGLMYGMKPTPSHSPELLVLLPVKLLHIKSNKKSWRKTKWSRMVNDLMWVGTNLKDKLFYAHLQF